MTRATTLFLLMGFLGACGQTGRPACDATNCSSGCCDARGLCQPGTSNFACGKSGLQCSACEAGTCRLGVCETGGFGGNAAGGNAAGGNAAGGNAAGGNAAGGNAAGGNAAGGNAAGGNAAGGNAAGGNAAGGNAAGGSAVCAPACPPGFTCNNGVCSGGNLSGVALNIATAPLTLDLRANSAPVPMTCGFNDIVGRVDITAPGGDLAGTAFFRACNSPLITTSRHPDPSTLSTRVSGNGLIPVRGSFSGPDILVSGPTTRTIDVTMVPVTGRVLANGAPVSCSTAGSTFGTLSFVNTGVRIDLDVTCTQGRAGFSASLPIRTYRVFLGRRRELESARRSAQPRRAEPAGLRGHGDARPQHGVGAGDVHAASERRAHHLPVDRWGHLVRLHS